MNKETSPLQNLDLPTTNILDQTPEKQTPIPPRKINKKILFLLFPLLTVLLLLLVLSLFVKPPSKDTPQDPPIAPTLAPESTPTPVLTELEQEIESIQNEINSSQILPLPDINFDISL